MQVEDDAICAICLVKVKGEEKYAICPNCEHKFHFEHLQTWLSRTSKCPYCKNIFSFEFMRIMRPYGNIELNTNSNGIYKNQKISKQSSKINKNEGGFTLGNIFLFLVFVFIFTMIIALITLYY